MLLPLYINQIREREYGALWLMTFILSLFNVILPLGLGNALTRSYYDYPEEKRPQLVTTTLVFLTALCIVCLLPMYCLSSSWAKLVLHDLKFKPHFKIIFILGFLQVIKLVPEVVLRLKMQSIKYVLVESIALIAQLSSIIYFVTISKKGIYGILQGTLIGTCIEVTGLFLLTWGNLSLEVNLTELKRMLKFGSPLIFGRLSAMCLQSIDRFFIQHYSPSIRDAQREVGLYSMANNVSNAVTLLVTMPFGSVWPAMQVSVMHDADAKEYYARVLTYVVYVATFLALIASCIAKDVFFLFGKYTDCVLVIPFLCVAATLDAASQALSVGTSLKRKTHLTPLIYGVSALVNIGFNFLLIPSYGMMGAAVATAEGFFVLCALRYFVSNHYLPVPYEWGRLTRIFITGIALYYLTSYITTGHTIVNLIIHFLTALSFPFWLVFLNFYDTRERKQLSRYWNYIRHWPNTTEFSEQS